MIRPLLLLAAAAVTTQGSAPAVHLNQIGFLPDAPKRAVVADPAAAPLAWSLVDARGKQVARGMTSVYGNDAASGDHVHRVDLSTVRTPGSYRLLIGDTSRPVVVGERVFAPLKYAALNYFYQTRAGIPIEARYAGGPQWARPAGHPHEIAPCFAGADERGNVWPGCGYTLDVTGGWYDAGDQGKYVVNGGIALWTLQNLYENGGDRSAFADGHARLPEAGNGINDLLDEARWEMRFLLAMQVPDGQRIAVPVGPQPRGAKLVFTTIDAGGMAHHKVADREWTPLPTPPASDPQPRLLFPPSTAATLNLAATAAQCARIWRAVDPAFSQRCLTAAERAYAAASRNPEVFAPETFTGSGSYGDTHLADEWYWATAELFATTGKPAYGDALRRMPAFSADVEEPNWASVAALGTVTLASVPGALPAADASRQRALIVAAADRFLAEEQRTGYQLPFAAAGYTWGSNAVILNRAIILALAHRFTGEARYRAGVVDAMDYILGRNPLDQSFVTGFGRNTVRNPHHRFWAHSLDPKLPGPPPGVLSGGPNSTAMSDDIARTMKGHCAPQRCWRDDIHAFALNEVAINWNAPLLWVAAYLDTPVRGAAATPRSGNP